MEKEKIEVLKDYLNKLEIAKYYIVVSDIKEKEEKGVSIEILKCGECYNKNFMSTRFK